mmetsp:Transcript_15582/g.24904  ORF Transcript_15582/g.24904 Transcript_15582/m.24904 type:complete len:133 (-) Transcript_15582:48-446(-)
MNMHLFGIVTVIDHLLLSGFTSFSQSYLTILHKCLSNFLCYCIFSLCHFLSLQRLLKAAEAGDLTTVRRLVETKSVNVEAKDNIGYTSLIWAARRGHIDTVRYLVEKANANVEAKNDYGRTPLIWAARRLLQ